MKPQQPSNKSPYQKEFEQLFEQHFPALFAYGLQLSADRELTKDQIQSLFLDLWEKQLALDAVEHWQAYLRKSLHRRIIKELKKRRTATHELAAASPIEPSYEAQLIELQTDHLKKVQVQKAMSALSDTERKVLSARFQLGLSYEEIATQTGKSKQTVYNQIHSAIKKLRKAILFSLFLFF
ncbi:MAG: sigma-70 family RNA polymerase sigma factor [Bacteroidota bacterium]